MYYTIMYNIFLMQLYWLFEIELLKKYCIIIVMYTTRGTVLQKPVPKYVYPSIIGRVA